jgi:hypothetical protein
VRAPKWFKESLAEEGARILEREITDEKAAEVLAEKILKDQGFTRDIAKDYGRRQLAAWAKQYRPYVSAEIGGQMDLFPELPRRLETSPGRFADQAVMHRKDWDAALRQAQTKANNANGFADAIQQAYDKVRPLLTSDDLTTADVWKPGGLAISEAI